MKKLTLMFILLLFGGLLAFSFPQTKADNTNLAVWPNDWGFYSEYGDIYYNYGNPQITNLNSTVTYAGNATMEIKGPKTAYNPARELDWTGNSEYHLPVSVGDNIYYSAWIKTDASSIGNNGNASTGGYIGFDLYHNNQRLWEYAAGSTTDYTYGHNFDYVINYTFIPYDSGWTKITLNTTIPDVEFHQDDYGNLLGGAYYANYIIPWFGMRADNIAESASGYFADTKLYINPTYPITEDTYPSNSIPYSVFNDNEFYNISLGTNLENISLNYTSLNSTTVDDEANVYIAQSFGATNFTQINTCKWNSTYWRIILYQFVNSAIANQTEFNTTAPQITIQFTTTGTTTIFHQSTVKLSTLSMNLTGTLILFANDEDSNQWTGGYVTYTTEETETPIPTLTPTPIGNGDQAAENIIEAFADMVAPLIILIAPAFLFGFMMRMGKWGYVIGITVGAVLGTIFLPAQVPIWLTFLIFLGVGGYVYSSKNGDN